MGRRMQRLPKKMLDLRAVISNESGFKLFIRHLIKDLCVENLIYLSYIIQFKTMYGFLVDKEMEFMRSRSNVQMEEDEDSDSFEEKEHHRLDEQEIGELYGWNMELPKMVGHDEKSNKTKQILVRLDDNELSIAMYQESLKIYNRFIRVSSKDEINISGKMRKSLKKYFEIEEIVSSVSNITSTITFVSSFKKKTKPILQTEGYKDDSFNFPTNKTNENSNNSMNVRLTHEDSMDAAVLNDNLDADDSENYPKNIEDDASIVGIDEDHEMEPVIINKQNTKNIDNVSRRASKFKQISQKMKNKKRIGRTRREKMRWSVCDLPNDNYMKLDWMQRFKIFDSACDSIEKLLRIDSYTKFTESDQYLMYCDQLRKKVSNSGIFGKSASHIFKRKNSINNANGQHVAISSVQSESNAGSPTSQSNVNKLI